MIGAKPLGKPLSAGGLMEQAAQGSPIHGRSRVDPEPDDPTRAVVHDNEDPMGFESEGLTTKEIHTPQAILCVAEERQPRGAIGLNPGESGRQGSVSRHLYRQVGQMSWISARQFWCSQISNYGVSSLAPAQSVAERDP